MTLGVMLPALLLFCAVAVGVQAEDPSQNFCCTNIDANAYPISQQDPTGATCNKDYSGSAAGGTVATCNNWVRNSNYGNGKAEAGYVCVDTNEDGKYTCVANTPGAKEDPHIRGLDGSNYILWGKNNTVYNFLSERNHHINVRLYHPAGHPDTQALYIDAVGLLLHSTRLAATMVKAEPQSYLTLAINDGPPFTFPGHIVDRAVDGLTSYSFRSPQKVTISSRDIVLSVVLAENFYINVMVDEVAANWGDVHGVLGQTHRAAFQLRYNYARGTAVGELPAVDAQRRDKTYTIQGQEDDYVTSGLLKADDKFSRFVAPAKQVSRKLFNDLAAATTMPRQGAGSRVRTDAGLLV